MKRVRVIYINDDQETFNRIERVEVIDRGEALLILWSADGGRDGVVIRNIYGWFEENEIQDATASPNDSAPGDWWDER